MKINRSFALLGKDHLRGVRSQVPDGTWRSTPRTVEELSSTSPRRSSANWRTTIRGGFQEKVQNSRIKLPITNFGFTLLELLVVISIIGILAGLGAVSFTTAQKKGRDAKRQADLKAIQNAMEQCYSLLEYSYPTALPDPPDPLTCGTTVIINSFPADPKKNADGSDRPYISVLTADSYTICADLEGDGVFDGTNTDFCVQNLQ